MARQRSLVLLVAGICNIPFVSSIVNFSVTTSDFAPLLYEVFLKSLSQSGLNEVRLVCRNEKHKDKRGLFCLATASSY